MNFEGLYVNAFNKVDLDAPLSCDFIKFFLKSDKFLIPVMIKVKEIRVDSGSMLKRIRTAPQGRAHRIRKRSNHVTLVLSSKTIT